MRLEVGRRRSAIGAKRTRNTELIVNGLNVPLQIGALRCFVRAVRTRERLLPGVDANVPRHVGPLGRSVPAEGAVERFVFRVGAHVSLQRSLATVLSTAVEACQRSCDVTVCNIGIVARRGPLQDEKKNPISALVLLSSVVIATTSSETT